MWRVRSYTSVAWFALLAVFSGHLAFASSNRQKPPIPIILRLEMGRAGCKVDMDDSTAGTTGTDGLLLVPGVLPGDHYLHADCPNRREMAFFVSPKAGEKLVLKPEMAVAGSDAPPLSPLDAAQVRLQLQQALQQAIRLRAQGQFEEAVQLLREATRLDPENSDLHLELGNTFLLDKDWARARVELIEAVRHDPQNADAHNGLGYALEKLGDLDGALKEYRIATNLEPDEPSYREHYMMVLVKQAVRQQEQAQKRK